MWTRPNTHQEGGATRRDEPHPTIAGFEKYHQTAEEDAYERPLCSARLLGGCCSASNQKATTAAAAASGTVRLHFQASCACEPGPGNARKMAGRAVRPTACLEAAAASADGRRVSSPCLLTLAHRRGSVSPRCQRPRSHACSRPPHGDQHAHRLGDCGLCDALSPEVAERAGG